MKLKVGDRFIHVHWLDEHNHPLLCTVTAVRLGWVYWKTEGDEKARMKFRLENAEKYVGKKILPKED